MRSQSSGRSILHWQNRLFAVVSSALFSLLMNGCSSPESLVDVPTQSGSATILPYDLSLHKRPVHIFNALTLEDKIRVQKLQARVDNLFVILDESDAMNDDYRDVSLRVYAREMLRRFNKTMPLGFKGQVYIFDGSNTESDRMSAANAQELGNYDALLLQSRIDRQADLMHLRTASLAGAINELTALIQQTPGRSAILLVTRWEQLGKAEREAIARLRQKTRFAEGQTIRDQVSDWQSDTTQEACIYAIGVGNAFSRVNFSTADTCGFGIAADKVAQPREMTHFVERILFTGPADADKDGIFDYQDRCPNTESGRLVRFDGCYRFGAMDQSVAAGKQHGEVR